MIQKTITIKTIEDILNPEEIQDYHREWNIFCSREGDSLESSQNVIRLPKNIMIGTVWQYKDYNILRSRILKKSWMPYDPPQPIWNPKQDYIELYEQMASAGRRLLASNSNTTYFSRALEYEIYAFMRKKIAVGQKGVSIELIVEEEKRIRRPIKIDELQIKLIGENIFEKLYFTFYNSKNQILARYFANAIWTLRAHEILIEEIKKGNEAAKEELLKKMKIRDKKLKNLKKELKYSTEYLIDTLNSGNMPEQELNDFFSYSGLT